MAGRHGSPGRHQLQMEPDTRPDRVGTRARQEAIVVATPVADATPVAIEGHGGHHDEVDLRGVQRRPSGGLERPERGLAHGVARAIAASLELAVDDARQRHAGVLQP